MKLIKPISHKKLLGDKWYEYPVLKRPDFEIIHLLNEDEFYSKIFVGQQDGFWVSGQRLLGLSFNPGRKWGVFNSKNEAILYIVQKNLPVLENHLRKQEMWRYAVSMDAGRKIKEALISIQNNILQPQLF